MSLQHLNRLIRLLVAGLVASVTLTACSVQQVIDALTLTIEDCIDEDGCTNRSSGTPLSRWAPPDLYVVSEFAERTDLPKISVLLKPRDLPLFCPEIPESMEATIDGNVLEETEWPQSLDCTGVAWELSADAWPADHAPESTVEITDGESTLLLNALFSLTQPPVATLDSRVAQPGETVEVQAVLPRADQLLVGPAQLQVEKEEPQFLDVTITEGGVRMQIPVEVATGQATLTLPYQVQANSECIGTQSCQASIYGELRFGIEVLAP